MIENGELFTISTIGNQYLNVLKTDICPISFMHTGFNLTKLISLLFPCHYAIAEGADAIPCEWHVILLSDYKFSTSALGSETHCTMS